MRFVWFFCLFLWVTSSLFGETVEQALKQVSLNDKLLMKKFVKLNIKLNQAAHVVYFENKPMCLVSTRIKSPKLLFNNLLWSKGWMAFKKNEHLFPHLNFIFSSHIHDEKNGWQTMDLFIINKRALSKCLAKHLHIFREVLGQDFAPELFISKLEEDVKINSLINNNEMLLGILLGYGEESSRAYQEMRNKYKGRTPPHTETYCAINIKTPSMQKIFPIGFLGNPHSTEVESLKSVYEEELDVFWKIYKKKDPLVLFLECISQDGTHRKAI